MDLPTIEMTPEAADERLKAYQGLLAHQRTAEDDRIQAGYRAIARGFPVLQLSEAIAAGGYFANGLPKIAIARADARTSFVSKTRAWHWNSDQRIDDEIVFGDDDRWRENRGAMVGTHTTRVIVPHVDATGNAWGWGQTIVPTVPPEHRPKRGRIRRFHILWEVERWTQIANRRAPGDPALLRHIGGDLWAVVATWDLTELERAVISGRR